jgi:hypothetical protein
MSPTSRFGPLSENLTIDGDIVTVYGLRIHGNLLRHLAEPTPEGAWFRVISVEDGVATVQQRTDLAPRSEKQERFPYEVREVGIDRFKHIVRVGFASSLACEQFYEIVKRRFDEFANR